MQQDSRLQSLETVLLVVIESLLSLLLRFDNELRQKAYPLVISDSLIAIRSYLPHDEVYLTFTFKGILLDAEMPEHKQRPDVIINAHSFEILNAIISDKDQAVNKLQFRGEEEQVLLIKDFLQTLSLSSLWQGLFNRFINKQSEKTKDSTAKQETKPRTDYKTKYGEIKEKQRQIEIENKRLSTQVAELKSRQSFFTILAAIALVIGIMIGWLVF